MKYRFKQFTDTYKHIVVAAFVIFFTVLSATVSYGADLNKTDKILLQKNFYLLYVLEKNNGNQLFTDNIFKDYTSAHLVMLNEALKNCNTASCYTNAALFTQEEIDAIGDGMVKEYAHNNNIKGLVSKLRLSGYYANFDDNRDTSFLRKIWVSTALGLNNILEVYVNGKAPRYPKVDAISFAGDDIAYKNKLDEFLQKIAAQKPGKSKFYTLPMLFSLKALELNGRDEAARYYPINAGMNKKAFRKISKTDWNKYPYSMILVPGLGPEEEGLRLDPNGAKRCDSAVIRYKNGKAPFIVVSGGHVHPNKTPYNEAVEMKKYMVDKLGIPASVIFIEPHARHTTTNLRNVNRIIYRFKIPANKPVLTVTDASQSKYILGMDKRCITELGYVPFKDMKKITDYENEYYPVKTSLHSNSIDPLDP